MYIHTDALRCFLVGGIHTWASHCITYVHTCSYIHEVHVRRRTTGIVHHYVRVRILYIRTYAELFTHTYVCMYVHTFSIYLSVHI